MTASAFRNACAVLVIGIPACSGRYAQTAAEPGGAGGSAGASAGTSSGGSLPCTSSLSERLHTSEVALDTDLRYRRRAYDNIGTDERVALGIGPDGRPSVAWLENAGSQIRITPLTADGARRDADIVLTGFEVGGLAVRPDGFMLLSRGPDPGEPLADPNQAGNPARQAALLSRIRNGAFEYGVPLTGTAQITNAPAAYRRDCTPTGLKGRFAFNGSRYGAYFAIHGCQGHPAESYYGDKLVYADDAGNYVPGGWSWNCSISESLQLLPETGAFSSFCFSTDSPFPGLNAVVEGRPPAQLAAESHTAGYVGGQFGAAVKMGDGSYVIAWQSRGGTSAQNPARAQKQAPDIALLQLGADYSPRGPVTYFTDTPNVAEYNVHLAPYGPDRLLLIWDSVENLSVQGETSFGTYTGTHLQLLSATGQALGSDEPITAPPNSEDDIAVYSNGDLGWAYLPDDTRGYASVLALDAQGVPVIPTKRSLGIARLTYCE